MTLCEEEEIKAFLVLNRLRIEGRRRALSLLMEGKSAREVVELIGFEDLFKEPLMPGQVPPFDATKEIRLCAQKGIDFLIYSDENYPVILKEIPDPPLLL